MRLKIGEISRLTGFSTSGIRFFEEAGVINPARGENEKYREFSLEDLQRLLICRKFRECGFSLEESVDMLLNADAQELKQHIVKQAECTRRHLAEKEALLEHLNQQIRDIDHLTEEESCCHIMQMPALYWLKLWQPGDDEKDRLPFSVVHEWFQYEPFTNSCLILPQESFLRGEGALETSWGIAIGEQFAEKLNFSPKPNPLYIASHLCLRVIITPNDDLTISADQLDDARSYILQNGYNLTGPALSRLFYSVIVNGKMVRHDHLWIPVSL
jgi:DNA-binding transcriptional MerR regulator